MDFSNFKTNCNGIPFCVMPEFQTWLAIHPDHIGFVIGSKGQTVKKIAYDCNCYIRIQDPNPFSGGMPWFMIRGSNDLDICEAYHRLCTIANEANRRLCRIGVKQCVNTSSSSTPIFKMAPVPKKKMKLKMKNNNLMPKKNVSFSIESPICELKSPLYIPTSPMCVLKSPSYIPTSPMCVLNSPSYIQ